jgi:general secretion pathway protein C
MVSRIAAFVIWAAVAASVVFWAMRLFVKPAATPAHATVVSSASGFKGDLSRLFGADDAPPVAAAPAGAPAPSADARFRLIGVVTPRSLAANSEGLALIAMDGKPPRAYRVGTEVDGEMVLLAVHSRGASLGPRGQAAQINLSLPALPLPASGKLSSLGAAPQGQRSQPGPPGQPMQLQAPPPIDQSEVAPQTEPSGRSVDEAPEERAPAKPQTSPGRSRPPM